MQVNRIYSELLSMTDKETMTHTFQLMGKEIEEFNKAFELSGFRTKSEFIRFCLFNGLKDLYEVKL